MAPLEWTVRRLPPMPLHSAERTLRKLSKKTLAARCWVATVSVDEYAYSASESWARCAELVEMVKGERPVDPELIRRLEEHRAHVVACKTGSCEHEHAALVRAGLESA